MKISPELGCSSRLMQRSRVDLPEPEGPMMQVTSPCLEGLTDAAENLMLTEAFADLAPGVS